MQKKSNSVEPSSKQSETNCFKETFLPSFKSQISFFFNISLILKFTSLQNQIFKHFKNGIYGSKATKVWNFTTKFNSVVSENLSHTKSIYKKEGKLCTGCRVHGRVAFIR